MGDPGTRTPKFPALSRTDRLVVLAVAVALFVALEGPVWQHLFDWDRSIGWSYLAVPVLVLLALVWRHRFSWLAWFLHSLELTFWKFAITAGILLLVLGRANPQRPAPPTPMATTAVPMKSPLPNPPASRGRLEGRVTGTIPADGAVVYLSKGVEDFAWPAPTATLRLTNLGRGFEPRLAVAQTGETLTAVSADHRLHTLVMTQAGTGWRLNAPVLASGVPTPIHPAEVEGLVTATCAVHGTAEQAATLVLLRHPFYQALAGEGRFAFEGVPPGPVTVTALLADGRHSEATTTIRDGATAHIEWALPTGP